MYIGGFFSPNNIPLFSLRHIGKVPLKNVQISIQDMERSSFLIRRDANNNYKSPLIAKISDMTKYGFTYASLYPNTSVDLPIPVEAGQNNIRMKIWIHLDNGVLIEDLNVTDFDNDDTRKIKLELKRDDKILEKIES